MKQIFIAFVAILMFSCVSAQTVTVVNPNGSEILYSCQTYTIKWNTSGTLSNYYDISYSLDGGIIWASVTSNYLSTNGQYVWTVPNVQSSTCLVRVRDAQNNTIGDISDAFFTINIPVTLISPNGGETLQGGDTYTINWDAQGTSNKFNLHYSINGGTTWTTIVTNYATVSGTYSWLVPNIPSTNVLVRVTDYVSSCMQDQSNAPFTIIADDPVLLTPNGGETIFAGCSYEITWTPATFYSAVMLEYSTNNGSSWTTILASTPNDGTQTWSVPSNLASGTCLIRASNVSAPAIHDVSNAVFAIVPPIRLVSPNGGETLYGCSTKNITWSRPSGCITSFDIFYSLNNGTTWTLITSVNNSNSGGSQWYTWSVPSGITSSEVLFKVSDSYNANVFDQSDAVVNIVPNNDITVTAPNGGEVFNALTTTTITWTNLPAASGQYNLSYSTNGGVSWTTIVSNITGNAYNWSIPNAPSSNCRIRVADAANTCKLDISDASFTINPLLPVLLTPNGGEVLTAGCSYDITWNSATFYSTVRIDYSADGGTTWTNIVASTANDGVHAWAPPYDYGSNYKVKISSTSNLLINDISEAAFTVKNPIALLSPNGGETLYGCSTQNIRWSRPSGCITSFDIFYSLNNGATWTLITSVNNSNSGSSQLYAWSVPSGITSSEVLFKVSDSYNANVFDQSDAVLNIVPSNDITVTAPNGGEVFNALTTTTITWTNLPAASGQYNLSYSTNGGVSWTTIVSNITGNAYNWSIPNAPSSNCRIRVADAANTCKLDISDVSFTINPPLPVLLTPNGGEALAAGCSYDITWNSATFYSTVRIDYSADGGTTWTNIVASTANDGVHAWTPPYNYGSNYKIKIANTSNLLITDISEASFTVKNPITLVSPNGGEMLYGCSTRNITWSRPSGCITSFDIFYSLNNGTTWTLITSVNNSNSGGSQWYTWSVPSGITSSEVLFKVSDSYNANVFDQSDAVVNIVPNNDITVTAPNGGEVFNALTTTTITWTNLPAASGQYNLSYSTNGGVSWTTIVSNITGNAYNWSIPNAPSSNCRIRVADAANTCKLDISDASFTINPLLPVLLTPNGGEVLTAGCSYDITWNSATFYSTVRIDYSADGGTTWTNIVASTANDGVHAWAPPYDYGSNYKVKISSTSNLLINDISEAAFTVKNPIALLSPNGGETLYGCSTQNIRWSRPSGCITSFDIFYSLNNGATWTLITSVNNSNSGSSQLYAWSVPSGITSSEVLFKVSDSYNANVFDQSDAVLNIVPSNDITVTAPNGGEVFNALTTTTITWTNLPAASGQYNLSYSTNGGVSWTTIVSNITGNAYNWSIPNAPSSNCRIRVADAANTCKLDISDVSFTINPPLPVLLTPNGGEALAAGCSYDITWNSATFYSTVRIDYSADGGTTWTNIVASTANDGIHAWTPPYNYGSNYKIKIANTSNLLITDISEAPFTVKNPIALVSPNGGETLYGCSTQNIRWSRPSGCITSFDIFYSLNNGTTWTLITSVNNSNSGGSQWYTWNVPSGITSSEVLFKVSDSYNANVFDQSDAVLNIVPNNDITVTAPNGGEVFNALTTTTITWTNLPAASGQYNLSYSTNEGSTWTTIASNVTGNSYLWTIPNIPSARYLIRVQDYVNTCKTDASNDVFTVLPATPVVLSPNGGETIYAATNYTITWDATTYYSTVRIDYSTDNGASWLTIAASTPNDGNQSWSVPNVASTQCLIKVSNTSNLSINDVSNAVFTIKPAVTVLTPNGNDGITNWGGCTVTSITFDHTPAYSGWNILYSLNGGTTWTTVASNWTQSANPATYNWMIPNTSSNNVIVRVEPYQNTGYGDQSDAPFTVNKPVTIIQPNFGGIMQVGSVYNISWSADGISNIYDIFFSSNGGATWSTVVLGYNTSTNTYPWTVPNATSSNCKIRVRDNINHCKEDTSDVPFTISSVAPALTVLSPNGGESLSGCTNKLITWAESSPHGTYDISYSTNSGTTWIPIVTNHVTSALSYNWTVPNLNSSTVLVKVKASGTAIEDLSNALFSLQNGNLTITTADTTICPGSPVQLNASGAASYTWTPATGLSNPNIANPVATPSATTTYTVQYTNAGCAMQDQVTITTNSTGALPVSVSVSASAASICSGTPVTFTATPSNGGTSPSYQWKINGLNVGTNSSAFTSSTLANNDQVSVVLTSNASCVSGNPATSNVITMSVAATATPSVSVSASATTVCSGTSVTFTATPVNPGASPIYEWKVNGNTTGINSPVFTSSSLLHGAIVTVNMTTNSACAAGGLVTSPGITMTVNSGPSQPTAISGAAAVCAGVSQTYSVAAVTGATSYTWSLPSGWTGTSTTPSINVLSGTNGGIISVVANNTCGSSPLQSKPLAVHSVPNVTATATATSICAGTPLTLSGTGAVSYVWTGAANGVSFTPSSTATYTVTGTDVNGCTDTDAITITVKSVPSVTAQATSTSICSGTSVTLSGSGAASYVWNQGVSNGVAFAPASTQTYTVTGTAANGCTDTDQVTVTVNALPTVNAGADRTVCANTPVTLSATGASSYIWSNGVTNGVAFNASSTTTYTVTGTAANGCTNTDQVTVTVNAAPTVIANSTATTICIGGTVTLTGSGANTYAWNNGVTNGVPFSPSSTQTYTVTGTAANGCTGSNQVTVTVNTLPNVTASASAVSVCAGTPVTLTGGGANNYSWNNGVLNGVAFTPSATQTYTVTGTSANGCTNTAQVTVTVNAVPTVIANSTTAVACIGGTVTLTGSGATTYTWNNGVTNGVPFSPSSTQTYTVTGTAANGCTGSNQVTVTVNTLPNVTASASAVSVCAGTPVTLTGGGTNNYSWNNGVLNGVAFTPSATQTYTVTGTSANGCTNTAQVTVTVNTVPTVIANSTTAVACIGGTVTLTGSGATTYTWNNGVTNGVAFSPSSTQTYTVTGTANGCSDTDQITISVNPLPNVTANASAFSVCAGSPVTLTGGGANNYSWNNGVLNGVAFTPSGTQTYTVTGTSVNGCTNTAQVTITVHAAPVITAGGGGTICAGSTATLTATGGALYSWNNGAGNGSSVSVSPLTSTIYTVTGTSLNGCIATDNVLVTVTDSPEISIAGNTTICAGGSTSLSASGATGYTWSNGVGTGPSVTVSPVSTTTYTVTGNAGSCVSTATVTVTVNALPVIDASGISQVCAGEPVVLTATGASSYNWNNNLGSGNTVTVTPTGTTTYIVTGTDANGCIGTDNITITVLSLPVPVITINDGQLQTGTYATYQWYVNNTAIPGATAQTWNYTENGNYYVEVTDGNGCGGNSLVTTVSTVSTDEYTMDEMSIYPNPAVGSATIDFGSLQGEKTVKLIDLTGKIIYEGSSMEQQLKVELNVAAGFYQVVVITSDQIIRLNQRLMVQGY